MPGSRTERVELLLPGVAAGDRAAALACVERWGDHLGALVGRFGLRGDDAVRALREIFAAIWAEAARYHPRRGPELFFAVQMARRRLLERRARDGACERAPAAPPPPASCRQGDLFGEAARVTRTLQALDPQERMLLELAVVHGLSYAEIASLVGLPRAAVRPAARRALLRVGELLHAEAREARSEAQP